MSLKTRLFGKKIRGQMLTKLLEAMGENPNELCSPHQEGNIGNLVPQARVSLYSTDSGIHVDMYLTTGTYAMNVPRPNLQRKSHYLSGDIDYDQIKARGSGTGTGYSPII